MVELVQRLKPCAKVRSRRLTRTLLAAPLLGAALLATGCGPDAALSSTVADSTTASSPPIADSVQNPAATSSIEVAPQSTIPAQVVQPPAPVTTYGPPPPPATQVAPPPQTVAPAPEQPGGNLGTAPIQKPPSGNFYRAGEFCPRVDAGKTTQNSSGRTLVCTDNNGLRWEYA